MNLMMLKESKLLRRDMAREDRSDTICNNFGYDLVKAVTERDGSKVIEG